MEKTQTTLNHFFPIKELSQKRLSQIAKNKEFSLAKEKMLKKLKSAVIPDGFFEQILKQVGSLLNVDIRAIVVSAWSQSRELVKYRNRKKYPANEIQQVHLVEHTITSEHTPSLKPYMNRISLGELKFKINLNLALKGAILKIQNGKIMEANFGSCEGNGTVKYGDFTILEKENCKLALPSTIDFGKGIPLNHPLEKVHNIIVT